MSKSSRITDIHNDLNIIFKSEDSRTLRRNDQIDLFPGAYWQHLNFVQRALLVERINQTTSKKFKGFLDTWNDLPAYFRVEVVAYLENNDKPIVFYAKNKS